MDSTNKLSHTSVMLHWVVGILMIGSLIFGTILEEMPRSPDKGFLVGLHISFGLIVLAFALWRVAHRMRQGMLEPLGNVSATQTKIGRIVMGFLLFGTLLMPISGILMQFGEGRAIGFFGLELIAASGIKYEIVEKIGHIGHGLGSKLMILAVALHIAAALKHHFIDKDGTMKRMMGRQI